MATARGGGARAVARQGGAPAVELLGGLARLEHLVGRIWVVASRRGARGREGAWSSVFSCWWVGAGMLGISFERRSDWKRERNI